MSEFRFKQFTVVQDDVPMKLGTDGVLLGAWAALGTTQRILDIGTGTGVIALMAAQRSAAQIEAIDIDEAAAQCASRNFAASPWPDRLRAHCCALQCYEAEPFDYILSNPPYFEDSLLSPDARRSAARHTTAISFAELDASVRRLMSREGRFALILPVEQFERFVEVSQLHLVRRCNVCFVEGGRVRRVMAEFATESQGTPIEENLAIETARRGLFSDDYRQLTHDFYLKF